MRADKVGRDTMLARIVQMVADAQRSRAPIQRLADQVSGYFVPVVMAVAVVAFVAWSVFGPEPRFAFGLVAAVAVSSSRVRAHWVSPPPCRSWSVSDAAHRRAY